MRPAFYLHFVILLLALVSIPLIEAETASVDTVTTVPCPLPPAHSNTVPSATAEMGCGRSLTYLGSYRSDGKFQGTPRFFRLSEPVATLDTPPRRRPESVPDFVNLHPRERIAEDPLPSKHAWKTFKAHSPIAEWRDDVITFAYGHETALLAPRYITTDSHGRAIISDPAAEAVHVLDDKNSFRIPAGNKYRLRSVGAVAVDGKDNIYVIDPELGRVEVFDPSGQFRYEFGTFSKDEGLFHDPAAIAIDRANERIYIVDSSRDMVFMLNLRGTVLKRAGGRRNESGIAFRHPTAIAIKNDQVIVVDDDGARIQILDLECNLLRAIPSGLVAGYARELGVDADAAGNIYLSNIDHVHIRVFDRLGNMQNLVGPKAWGGTFADPAAVWIDSANRLYVSEKTNRRIQVFQINRPSRPSATPGT